MNWQHDFVFFEQRAVGIGKPHTPCPNETQNTLTYLKSNLNEEQDAKYWFDLLKQCRNYYKKSLEIDLITTHSTVDDVVNLSHLLPAQSWNIYAISYGTRVALELLKRKDIKLRAVIVDSVYPQNKNELLVTPQLMNDAYHNLFTECRLSYFCKTNAPNLRAKFDKIVDRLKNNPIYMTVKPAGLKKPITVAVNNYRFVWAVFQSMYSWKTIEKLPDIFNRAAAGDINALKPVIEKFADYALDTNFSLPAFYSVECFDRELDNYDNLYAQQVQRFPRYKPYLQHLSQYDACKAWTTKRAPKSSFELTHSDVPTLVINGELDPVTPWTWAKEAAKNLSHRYLFIVEGIGHAAIDSDDCSRDVARAFLKKPNEKPHLRCTRLWKHADFKFNQQKTPQSAIEKPHRPNSTATKPQTPLPGMPTLKPKAKP